MRASSAKIVVRGSISFDRLDLPCDILPSQTVEFVRVSRKETGNFVGLKLSTNQGVEISRPAPRLFLTIMLNRRPDLDQIQVTLALWRPLRTRDDTQQPTKHSSEAQQSTANFSCHSGEHNCRVCLGLDYHEGGQLGGSGRGLGMYS